MSNCNEEDVDVDVDADDNSEVTALTLYSSRLPSG